MRFDIFTLFPGLFEGVFDDSIVKRARERGLIEINLYNIRDYAPGKHRVTDDYPFGGGGGMVMKVEPILLALEDVLGADLVAEQKASGEISVPIALMTPAGRRFDQAQARRYEQAGHIAIVCGRYEGVDERLCDMAVTDQVSIGDFVLSGGEIPAMAIVEAVTRLIPGVLGDMRAVIDDSHSSGLLEYPHYTRPERFRDQTVPAILLSGDHARVARWRRDQALQRTLERRPDMLDKAKLSKLDLAYLADQNEGD